MKEEIHCRTSGEKIGCNDYLRESEIYLVTVGGTLGQTNTWATYDKYHVGRGDAATRVPHSRRSLVEYDIPFRVVNSREQDHKLLL